MATDPRSSRASSLADRVPDVDGSPRRAPIFRVQQAPPPESVHTPSRRAYGRRRRLKSALLVAIVVVFIAAIVSLLVWLVPRVLGSDSPAKSSAAGAAAEDPPGDRIVGTTLGPEPGDTIRTEPPLTGTAGGDVGGLEDLINPPNSLAIPSVAPYQSSSRLGESQAPLPSPAAQSSGQRPRSSPRSASSAQQGAPSKMAAPDPARPPAQTSGIRAALMAYRDAVEGLNAAAVQAVWPSADAAGLSRTFDQLYQQRLELEDCRIASSGSTAAATCAGTLRFVPKTGSRSEQVERRQWEFSLRAENGSWLIDRVSTR